MVGVTKKVGLILMIKKALEIESEACTKPLLMAQAF